MKELAFDALLRNSFPAFIEKAFKTVDNSQDYIQNWHIEVLADYLERCMKGDIKRLIINVPPRSLKSICASVAFPAFLLGYDPTRRVVCVSYSDGLASKLARDCRSLMESGFYKRVFPNTVLNPAKRNETEFETTENGYRLATSVNGTLTGRGGNMIIIDDPIKPQEALSDTKRETVNQWYNNTLLSRLDNKHEGCIIIVMQRVHMDDLTGFVQVHEDWEVLSLPALAEENEVFNLSNGETYLRGKGEALNSSLENTLHLETTKNKIGGYNFSAQYQQRPMPVKGNIIKWEWFHYFEDLPQNNDARCIVQSWDTAMKAHDGSDYSVCITIEEIHGKYYILDVSREKLDFPSLKKKVIQMQEMFDAHSVVIEDKGSGTALIQSLKRGVYFPVLSYMPEGTKADRMVAQSVEIEAGHVFLPKSAIWLDDFKAEIISFPHGRHDDQIDALSQGLHWLKNHQIIDYSKIL